MKLGETDHNAVVLLQEALIAAGCPMLNDAGHPIPATGNYLGKTAAAVRRAQQRAIAEHFQPPVHRDSGIVGREVLAFLDAKLLAWESGAQPPSYQCDFVIEGRTYRLEGSGRDLHEQFEHVKIVMFNRLSTARGDRQRFIDRQNSVVRAISDTVSG